MRCATMTQCFFCLGASSVGMSPEDYRRLTYDLTLAVARQLLPENPRMVFEYISGEGTAPIRGRTGRASKRRRKQLCSTWDSGMLMPSGPASSSRCVVSRARIRSVRWMYAVTAPAYPIIQKMFGRWVTSADLLAAAMLQLATAGSNKKALNTGDLNRLATQMGN
jgi:hypothetical protein